MMRVEMEVRVTTLRGVIIRIGMAAILVAMSQWQLLDFSCVEKAHLTSF